MKNIVMGVTGSIAVYKVPSLIRELRQKGINVDVIMTEHATKFISPLTLQTVSNNQVHTDMFTEVKVYQPEHITLAKKATLIAIIPATANIIGKIATGLADDLLSATVMATSAKVLIAPAMNSQMYHNPIVQENIKKLKQLGYIFIGPEKGKLICEEEAEGRLADKDKIISAIEELLKK
jgi:phosphopantothenoylcysteine decarboxylase/phosphopantothenate--cysteine ligase